jgi:hypothetical protein
VHVRDVALFAAARGAGVPTAVHQHGGFLGYPEVPAARIHELACSDAYLAYGEGVTRWIETQRVSVDPVAVGSSALDSLRGAARTDARTVVYAPTMLMGDARYFSRHIYPDIWYWRLQRIVVERCARLAPERVLVKLPPAEPAQSPLARWIADREFPNVDVVRDVAFADVVADAGLVVLDSPATTLLQALAAGVPVVAFADSQWMTFHADAVEQLRRTASFSTDVEAFLEEVERAIAAPPQPDDHTFLREYGTHLDDGRSAQRAAAALETLATR